MTVHSPTNPRSDVPQRTATRGRFTVTAWVLGIVGAVGSFLGAFILLAGDDQSVGLGGEASWRVGDIDPAWGYGLLIGGALALVATLALVVWARTLPAATTGTERSGWADVLAHAAVFLVVNAFLWAQDIALGGGLDYAYWVTIPWGIGLTVHAFVEYSRAHAA